MSLTPSIALLSSQLVCRGQVVAPDAAALVRLLLLAPVLEEWVVRAGLQEWLIRCTDGRARAAPVALSAAAFALLHAGSGWRAVLSVLAPGLVLALLYQHRRDWRLCALAHCGMNALALGGCVL
ncbi:JDVT-CTERM system glutamic-type intramembrane protease [Massilia pinisoli]|uniref:JDVT-CTERM system glutamic-type intramembrane protease n=1 Tax=Massilia pinisoli TaxID=1772194 RepID=A0ABT1ZSR9_9BURK|nr:JDVT-CTERM system glutamic-type intramembrane protease [Massilia pinisoli]MCS0582929.1 JDVT-CTERM system glutamic-type intramembrane protease [Massilia pinisoli]